MIPEFCREFFDLMDDHPDEFCWEVWQQRRRVERAFEEENLIVEQERYERYLSLAKYLNVTDVLPWEKFLIGCLLCTYRQDGRPRWYYLFQCSGRGAGKDIVISWFAMCLVSPYNPIPDYDVDIFGYVEDQAIRPVKHMTKIFKKNKAFFSHFFKWTTEKFTGLENGGTVWGHANNAKAGDGLRSGAVIYNEVHAYENGDQIAVGTSGLGKVKDGRELYFTTNGNVSDGPFDEMMKEGKEILSDPNEPDQGKFFFIWKLDDKNEADDERMWNKANPSLRYMPELLEKHRTDHRKWKNNPKSNSDFMTKRMNIRQSNKSMPVAEWEQIARTAKPIPWEELDGAECIAGIDYAMLSDWFGVNLHFLMSDGRRIDVNHAWICKQSRDIWRLKCPYKEWAEEGHVTIVDDVEISPYLAAEWIAQMETEHNIRVRTVVIDNFRYELVARAFGEYGFSKANGNLVLYRPRDIMRIVPSIISAFDNDLFIWGDNPALRWACNNTKLVPAKGYKIAAGEDNETGNFILGKIERLARKTDPFFALVASMTEERQLAPADREAFDAFECWSF